MNYRVCEIMVKQMTNKPKALVVRQCVYLEINLSNGGKTYANKAPHEYIVRGNISGTDDEFMAAVNYIQLHGITMLYWGHPNKYFFLDGRQYWVMRDDENDPTTIPNRCNCDEYDYSTRWKGTRNEK